MAEFRRLKVQRVPTGKYRQKSLIEGKTQWRRSSMRTSKGSSWKERKNCSNNFHLRKMRTSLKRKDSSLQQQSRCWKPWRQSGTNSRLISNWNRRSSMMTPIDSLLGRSLVPETGKAWMCWTKKCISLEGIDTLWPSMTCFNSIWPKGSRVWSCIEGPDTAIIL